MVISVIMSQHRHGNHSMIRRVAPDGLGLCSVEKARSGACKTSLESEGVKITHDTWRVTVGRAATLRQIQLA